MSPSARHAIYWGNATTIDTNVFSFPFTGQSVAAASTTGKGLSFYNYGTTEANAYAFAFTGGTLTPTAGTFGHLILIRTFAPTSGTGLFHAFTIQPTINQTGGANGITRGLYINPVITAAADWRSLEVATGRSVFAGPVSVSTATELTIATGVITKTKSFHKVDTEADGATDDLVTISGGAEGDTLILRAENTARDVVLKDGTGNLQLEGDFTLDNTQDVIQLIHDGTNWLEVSRSNNGA